MASLFTPVDARLIGLATRLSSLRARRLSADAAVFGRFLPHFRFRRSYRAAKKELARQWCTGLHTRVARSTMGQDYFNMSGHDARPPPECLAAQWQDARPATRDAIIDDFNVARAASHAAAESRFPSMIKELRPFRARAAADRHLSPSLFAYSRRDSRHEPPRPAQKPMMPPCVKRRRMADAASFFRRRRRRAAADCFRQRDTSRRWLLGADRIIAARSGACGHFSSARRTARVIAAGKLAICAGAAAIAAATFKICRCAAGDISFSITAHIFTRDMMMPALSTPTLSRIPDSLDDAIE